MMVEKKIESWEYWHNQIRIEWLGPILIPLHIHIYICSGVNKAIDFFPPWLLIFFPGQLKKYLIFYPS